MLFYAEIVIFIKYTLQLSIFAAFFPNSFFIGNVDKFKIGLRIFDKSLNATSILGYIIWDIFVALTILLHEHCLVYFGLWENREHEIENLEQAYKRIAKLRAKEKRILSLEEGDQDLSDVDDGRPLSL